MQLDGMLGFNGSWRAARGPQHDIVLSSRVRLARNLASGPFPTLQKSENLLKIRDRVFGSLKATRLKEAAFLKVSELDDIDRRFLVERHLISPHLAQNAKAGGVAFDASESLSLMINEEDHLRLSSVSPGLSLTKSWEEADGLDDELTLNLDISYRKDWGFLTACPTNLGTGLRASCLMHLPVLGLTGELNPLLEILPRAGLTARGLFGEGTKVIGDWYQISNNSSLGKSEAEFISAVEKSVTQLCERERRAREKTASGPGGPRLRDLVHRAAGLLTSARLMSNVEAYQHLSLLRAGFSLGEKLPGSLAIINELLLVIQPAHLAMRARRELNPSERDEARAELIRNRLGPGPNK